MPDQTYTLPLVSTTSSTTSSESDLNFSMLSKSGVIFFSFLLPYLPTTHLLFHLVFGPQHFENKLIRVRDPPQKNHSFSSSFSTPTQPPTMVCKMEGQSEYVHVAHTFFARLAPDSCAQSVLANKNFCVGAQSEVY